MDASGSIPGVAVLTNFSTFGLIVLVLLALSLSAYVKIATVLGILRAGLGFASIPSVFVTGALALALSYSVMHPVIVESSRAMEQALGSAAEPDLQRRLRAFDTAVQRWSLFLRRHAHDSELERFSKIAERMGSETSALGTPASEALASGGGQPSLGLNVLAPAFLISQLKEAFSIGLRILLPFLVIDLIVAVLLSISGIDRSVSFSLALATKLLIFVSVDGWTLITGSMLSSYAN